MQTSYLNDILIRLELKRIDLYKNVLDANERAINDAPLNDREELYKAHDAIVDFINDQTESINILVAAIQNMYSKSYVVDLKNQIAKQRKYIEILGGNPSDLNFVKMTDF